MKIRFYNVIKNTLPLIVNCGKPFDDYFKDLSPSSKRFLNLSYRIYNTKLRCVFDYKLPPLDKLKLSHDSIAHLIKKKYMYLKIYDKDELIAYNRFSANSQFAYCSCLYIFNNSYVNIQLFNTFSWFKFIELTIKNDIIPNMDLVVDKNLYNYFQIENEKPYDINSIETAKSYTLKRDKSGAGFNTKNSSKFLFLSKTDKMLQKDWIAVVCQCDYKNYIDIMNSANHCYNCKTMLSNRDK